MSDLFSNLAMFFLIIIFGILTFLLLKSFKNCPVKDVTLTHPASW